MPGRRRHRLPHRHAQCFHPRRGRTTRARTLAPGTGPRPLHPAADPHRARPRGPRGRGPRPGRRRRRGPGHRRLDPGQAPCPRHRAIDAAPVGQAPGVVRGINAITPPWTEGDRKVPVDYRVHDEADGRTEDDHFRGMMLMARTRLKHDRDRGRPPGPEADPRGIAFEGPLGAGAAQPYRGAAAGVPAAGAASLDHRGSVAARPRGGWSGTPWGGPSGSPFMGSRGHQPRNFHRGIVDTDQRTE